MIITIHPCVICPLSRVNVICHVLSTTSRAISVGARISSPRQFSRTVLVDELLIERFYSLGSMFGISSPFEYKSNELEGKTDLEFPNYSCYYDWYISNIQIGSAGCIAGFDN